MAKLSIITAHYGQEKFVKQCVQSVRMCDSLIEYIFIDGATPDLSTEIECFLKENCDVYVSEQDEGQSQALNKGISLATGDYIGYMNADDYYLPGALDKLIELMDISGADFVYGGQINLNEDSQTVSLSIPTGNEVSTIGYCSSIFEPATIWKKEVWEELGPFDESLHYVFGWDFLAKAGKKFRSEVLKEPVSINRIYGGRKTNDDSEERRVEIVRHVECYGGERWLRIYEEALLMSRSKPMKVFNRLHGRFKKALSPLLFSRKFFSYDEYLVCQNTLFPAKLD